MIYIEVILHQGACSVLTIFAHFLTKVLRSIHCWLYILIIASNSCIVVSIKVG